MSGRFSKEVRNLALRPLIAAHGCWMGFRNRSPVLDELVKEGKVEYTDGDDLSDGDSGVHYYAVDIDGMTENIFRKAG